MTQIRDSESCTGTSLADILQSALPPSTPIQNSSSPAVSSNGNISSYSSFMETKSNNVSDLCEM